MKSTTWPRVTRSQRLPMAPPSTRASASGTSLSRCGRRSITTRTTEITIATTVKNQRCQPPAPARKLKAAPVLWVRIRLKKGAERTTSPFESAPLTHALVARSSTTTAALTASQRAQPGAPSRMRAPFALALEVLHAAPAKGRVARIRSHVGPVVPAPFAFRIRGRPRLDGDRAIGGFAYGGRRRDQHELEVVAQRSQERQVLRREGERHV